MTIIHASIQYDDEGNTRVVTDDPESDHLRTDWDRLASMTDEELRRNAEDDPDAPPLTDDQRARLRLASSIRNLRHDLGLTPEEFCDRFGFDLPSFRDWERGRRVPDAPSEILLRLIAQQPDLVAHVVKEARTRRADAAD